MLRGDSKRFPGALKRSLGLGGLAASAPERIIRQRPKCPPEEARLCYCDANPAALYSPTHATTDHVTSKAHTGELTFPHSNLAFPSQVGRHTESHMCSLSFSWIIKCNLALYLRLQRWSLRTLQIWCGPDRVRTSFKNKNYASFKANLSIWWTNLIQDCIDRCDVCALCLSVISCLLLIWTFRFFFLPPPYKSVYWFGWNLWHWRFSLIAPPHTPPTSIFS